ncbi:hypothetical protein ACIBPB_23200 [Micromonospora sp. NPDC049836]|uniref:hypothetical protein n=1 Tax=Micromonospora sp. NPDC049836 TaxID=3364274 RepID=UPI0037905BCD
MPSDQAVRPTPDGAGRPGRTLFPADGVNPYLPTPVARVGDSATSVVTVATTAVVRARAALDEYLRAPHTPEQPRKGRVLTLVGDFGTGKTHLTAALRRRVLESAPAADPVYLDAPNGTFVDLYRRFIAQVKRPRVMDLLSDYYAEVVADELEATPYAARTATRLRQGEIDPVAVVARLHLPDRLLLQRLQATLIRVTRDNDLGTAFTLLLQPEVQTLVWDWLTGNPPRDFLQERGIFRTIATDGAALDAMAAFGRLHRDRGRPAVLMIDEFDRVLSAVDSRSDFADRMGPFKRMLEAVGESGAFVVLAGMPEIVKIPDESTRQRLGEIVELTPMTVAEVQEFIRSSHRAIRGDDALEPFTQQAVETLVALTKGVPRQFITLCHYLYGWAQGTQELISPEVVRQVSGVHFDLASVLDVRREVYQVLTKVGIRVSRGHLREPGGEAPVDYWVSDSQGEYRCAILLTGGVVSPADVTEVRQRAARARAEAGSVEVVLVVVGYLTEAFAAQLVPILKPNDPIVYGRESFPETLQSVVTGVLRRHRETVTANPLEVIIDGVERISRQQSTTQELIEYVAQHLAGIGETTERQLTEIRREVASTTRGGDPPASARSAATPTLAAVDELFQDALRLLSSIDRMEDDLSAVFVETPGRPANAGVRAVQARLRQQEGFSPLGTAVFLGKLVQAFQYAFLDWYDASELRAGGQPSPAERDRLDRICTRYEALYHDIPLDELKKLVESSARDPEHEGVVSRLAGPTIRLDDIRRTFAELGVRVGRAVDGSAGRPG